MCCAFRAQPVRHQKLLEYHTSDTEKLAVTSTVLDKSQTVRKSDIYTVIKTQQPTPNCHALQAYSQTNICFLLWDRLMFTLAGTVGEMHDSMC